MKNKKSLIGKKYIPRDNSFILILSRDIYRKSLISSRLAGSINELPKECIIISEPYKQKVGDDIHEFINVSYNNDEFRVLFYQSDVDANIIEKNKQHKNFINSLKLLFN